jgi:uncharacterized membrane protein
LKQVRRDLRAMRRTDKVMYYSILGASIFLLADLLTMAFAVYIILKTS